MSGEPWYAWVFSRIGVELFKAAWWMGLMKTGCRMLDRDQVDRAIGTVGQRIASAESTLWISGNDCKFAVESSSVEIEAALKRGVRVKVLCVDPNSSAAQMLSHIDPRFPASDSFAVSMQTVLPILADLAARYPAHFEYRLLPILPAQGFFIVDPTERKGLVKVELYTAKEWLPVRSRPHLILTKRSGRWRQYFLGQWENYWALGHRP